MILKIPTINDKGWDFDQLFGLWAQANHDNLDVTLDFSGCGFLRQNGVAFLGGVMRLVESRGGRVQIDHATLRNDVRRNLTKNRFLTTFGEYVGINPGNSIPYREDRIPDETGLTGYLKDDWLGKGGVHVSDHLRNAIVGTVWEIYTNAFEHAGSEIGILSCGQQFPRLKTLELTIVDFGLGIPANVRTFFSDPSLPSEKALEWAFRPGTTTRPGASDVDSGLTY